MAVCFRRGCLPVSEKDSTQDDFKDHKRPDGRKIDQIRPLAAEIDLIPRVHGSAMFTRGQTQICTVTTLAPLSDAQRIDGLDEAETSKRYMHHYNFPILLSG